MDEEIRTGDAAQTPESAPENAPDPEELAARLAAAETENRLYRLAPGLGVSAAAVPYLARLCPAEPGADDEAIRRALEEVLAALPGLREKPASGPGGIRLGAGLSPAGDDETERLRAAFGIR